MWYYNQSSKSLHEIVAKNTIKGAEVAIVASYYPSADVASSPQHFIGYEKIVIKDLSFLYESILECKLEIALIHTKSVASILKDLKTVRRSDLAGVIMRAQSLLNDYEELSRDSDQPEVVSLKKCTSLIQALIGKQIDQKTLECCTYLKANTEFFHRGEYPHKAISLSFSSK